MQGAGLQDGGRDERRNAEGRRVDYEPHLHAQELARQQAGYLLMKLAVPCAVLQFQ